MQSRMTNPAFAVPGAMSALQAISQAAQANPAVSHQLHALVHLRASQINGCSVCVDMHAADLKKLGDTDRRIIAVSAWRETSWFTPAERAALALTEAVTRLSDRADPVPDAIWDEARAHFDEAALASLVLSIGMINIWNRLNATTRQIAGAWKAAA
jgi:AhpD family alkylhydroperoxidase